MYEAKQEIKQIYRKYERGNLPLGDALSRMDSAIGGITGIEYTPQKMVLLNHQGKYSLDTRNQGNYEIRQRENFAISAYLYAQDRGSQFPGELHLGKEASTKHHKEGLERIIQQRGLR